MTEDEKRRGQIIHFFKKEKKQTVTSLILQLKKWYDTIGRKLQTKKKKSTF